MSLERSSEESGESGTSTGSGESGESGESGKYGKSGEPTGSGTSGESSPGTPGLEQIVAALEDDACRRVVSVLEDPLTVDEIADRADLPLSSTYKKLDRLTDAGLVTEAAGVRQGRHHKSRYVAEFDRIAIGLEDDRSFRVDVGRSNDASLDIWSDATTEF